MKKVLLFLVAVLFCASFYSCDKDKDNTNLVRYQVSISDPTVIAGFTGLDEDYISVYDGWEYEEETDAETRDIWVSTSEEGVIVTLKVYVNNKLKLVEQNKCSVHAYVIIQE